MLTDPTLADQMFWMVDVFLKTLAREGGRLRIGLVSGAIWNRVRRLERRFLALYAMWKAGRVPKARAAGTRRSSPRPSPRRGEGEEGVAMSVRPASLLPRGLRWMQAMLPESARTIGAGVESLVLNYPEMRAFVADCPQVGRVLRPLCRMAGIGVPEYWRVPRRRGTRRTSPRPSPRRGEGEEPRRRRTAREVAAAALERSARTGKPIDPRRIGAVAFGYVLHWPRDGNCPPPEVGYGGRSFTPLPKDYVRPKD